MRKSTEVCTACGCVWTQDWEEPIECPRCEEEDCYGEDQLPPEPEDEE